MTQMLESAVDIDLNDTEAFVTGDPHELWARLRKEAPVHWNPTPEGGFWARTKFDDVLMAFRDTETFSSEHGTVIGGSFRNEVDTASGRMLVTSDAQRHRQLRDLAAQLGAHGEAVELLEDLGGVLVGVAQRLVRRILDGRVHEGQRTMDFVPQELHAAKSAAPRPTNARPVGEEVALLSVRRAS